MEGPFEPPVLEGVGAGPGPAALTPVLHVACAGVENQGAAGGA